ncbi:MAG: MATE family efflux transporter, partial [Lachnospiraceae bacterium]|nr:MATE family efflux transporter [Lachnospiraceae bacterium]
MTREEKLERGPIVRTMLAMGIPTFIAQFINLLYNIVDRIYIGHIPECGAQALTGVGVCFPIITFVSAFTSLMGMGGAPLAGIELGKKEREKAEKILGNSASSLVILSVILMVVFQIIKKPFLFMFGASEATYVYAGPYLTIYLTGTIFAMLSIGLNAYITTQGASVTAMLSVIIGAVVNMILDPIFIFGLNLGVQGAAIATVISQAISAIWVLAFLFGKKATLRLRVKYMIPDIKIIGKICSLGISPFIMGATESLISVIFNSGAQKFGGDLYVGSITILQSVMQIVSIPLNGFASGVVPIISYNYGAKNMQRVKKTALTLIGITFSVSAVLTLIAMFIPESMASLFTTDKELVRLCGKVMPVFMSGMLIFGLQSGSQNSFMALGKAKQSLFFALLRKVILLSPLAIILPRVMDSVMGIYYAEPISDVTSAL